MFHMLSILLIFFLFNCNATIIYCRLKVSQHDITTLVSFFERSQDVACIEDVLHMIIRALSHNSLLSSFLEKVNPLGGCYIFINLLKR